LFLASVDNIKINKMRLIMEFLHENQEKTYL